MNEHDSLIHRHLHYHTFTWKQAIGYTILGACLATYAIKGGCSAVVYDAKNTIHDVFVRAENKLEKKVKKFIDEVQK